MNASYSRAVASFWSRVDKSGSCWLWTGATYGKHYGQFRSVCFPSASAHKVSWIIANGPVPDGLHVLHMCDGHLCVRPSHLFLGTNQDNVDDMISKGRQATGDATGPRRYRSRYLKNWLQQIKLSPDDVKNIRRRYSTGNYSYVALASEYGVCASTIANALAQRYERLRQ